MYLFRLWSGSLTFGCPRKAYYARTVIVKYDKKIRLNGRSRNCTVVMLGPLSYRNTISRVYSCCANIEHPFWTFSYATVIKYL